MSAEYDPRAADINARIKRAATAHVEKQRKNLERSAGYCLAEVRASFEYVDDWEDWLDEHIDADLALTDRLLAPYPPGKPLPLRPVLGDEWIAEPWRDTPFMHYLWGEAKDLFAAHYVDCDYDAEQESLWWEWFAPYDQASDLPRSWGKAYYAEVAPVLGRLKDELRDARRRAWEPRWAEIRARNAARVKERAAQRKQVQVAGAFRYDRELSFDENAQRLGASEWLRTRPKDRRHPETAGARRFVILNREGCETCWTVQAFSKDGAEWGLRFSPPGSCPYVFGWGGRYASLEDAKRDAFPAFARHLNDPRSRKPTLPSPSGEATNV